MSAERTGARLLRAYPLAWRRRYGRELESLIVESCAGGRVGWRTRLDVLLGGGRERLRAAGRGFQGSPGERLKGSLVLVLCAWALFTVGGLIVQRFSEHWQAATPPAVGALPSIAFAVLAAAAAVGTVLVAVASASALPAFTVFLRDGGWPRIRGRVLVAALLTALALAATAALAAGAASLDSHQREGGDVAYAAGFLVCAALVCGCLAAWTAAAVAIARRIEIPASVLRLQSWLAAGVAVTMATMTAALVVWWVVLANADRSFLASDAGGAAGAAVPPQLVVAAALMLAATALAATASRRALRARVGFR